MRATLVVLTSKQLPETFNEELSVVIFQQIALRDLSKFSSVRPKELLGYLERRNKFKYLPDDIHHVPRQDRPNNAPVPMYPNTRPVNSVVLPPLIAISKISNRFPVDWIMIADTPAMSQTGVAGITRFQSRALRAPRPAKNEEMK